MLGFHHGLPHTLRCYVLLVFYVPVHLWKLEESALDHLTLGQAYGDLMALSVVLVSLLLPNALFVSGYIASVPLIARVANAAVVYTALVSLLVLEYPTAVMLVSCLGCVHVLWTMAAHLRGTRARSLVMGGLVRGACMASCAVLPWLHYLLGPPLMLQPRDLIFAAMSVEIVGYAINLVNAVTLGAAGSLFGV